MGINLIGTWQNELGSTLTIESVQYGVLSGTYETAVSDGSCAGQRKFQVSGVTDTDRGGHNIGFTVSWYTGATQCNSVTAWSGQVLNPGPGQHITAFWLLTVETDQADSWKATLIGQDHFTYGASHTPEAIAEKSKVVPRSHP